MTAIAAFTAFRAWNLRPQPGLRRSTITAAALRDKGYHVHVADDLAAAKAAVLDLVPGPSGVELTGFEPVTSSLRKMRSKASDQGKRHGLAGLWRGCGASDVRHRET